VIEAGFIVRTGWKSWAMVRGFVLIQPVTYGKGIHPQVSVAAKEMLKAPKY